MFKEVVPAVSIAARNVFGPTVNAIQPPAGMTSLPTGRGGGRVAKCHKGGVRSRIVDDDNRSARKRHARRCRSNGELRIGRRWLKAAKRRAENEPEILPGFVVVNRGPTPG